MKPNTRIAIASLLSAAGSLLNAFAAEFGAEAPASPEAAAAPEPQKPRRKAAAAAPAQPETPAEPATAEEPASTEGGKTYEELRALIEPLVKAGQGPDVKTLIAKYDPEGNPPSLKTMPAKNHAAFEKDLQALSY